MCDSGGQLEIQGKNQYDGVKVGCTFVTNEALEAILAMRRTA
jgi:hypothetical protein